MRHFSLAIVVALAAAACGGTTTPTAPPPPVEQPPTITCPAPQTVRLTAGTSTTVTYAPTTTNGRLPVTVVCTPPSGSTFGIGLATVNCVATDALQRTAPCSFAVTVLAPLPPPTLLVTSILAFGDSLTLGEDGRNSATAAASQFLPRVVFPAEQTYPGVLTQDLIARYTTQVAALRVDNGGKGGEAITNPSTSDGPSATTRFNSLLPGHGAVLIMEGTNDLQMAHVAADKTAQDGILDRAAEGLRTMVQAAKASGVRPFLATIAPMNPTGSRGATFGWELVSGFNDRIVMVASLEQVQLVDVNKAFAGNLGLLGSDGVHPTAAGYKLIADTFFTAISSTLEVKTSSITPSFTRR
ncbi:MAG: GDSL-like Lipase/Acylhydrolase [Acidobacteria bacterium]|nr:GDSL-like Lipase/Acylhydrolase [Acidobacteriota bacterium]